VKEFFRLVGEVQPKYFIMENVANLATAAIKHRPIDQRPGKRWSLKSYETNDAKQGSLFQDDARPMEPEEMAGSAIRALVRDIILPLGYYVTFGVLDSADYGAPQHRLRLIILGSRDWPPPALPAPTHGPGLATRVTIRDAIWHLRNNPGPHPNTLRRWRDSSNRFPKAAIGETYRESFTKKLSAVLTKVAVGKPAFSDA